MTFTELKTEIMDRLNLSSSSASTRVGQAINRTYRKVTTTIGLQMSRRATTQEVVTMGVSTVVFSSTEKIIDVWNRAVTPYARLESVTLDELREEMPYPANDSPTRWAAHSHTSDSVTIEFNRVPQTGFTLYADVHSTVADLSGSNEPAFPESFHDVIIEGVLADEYRKLEKLQYAQMSQKEYERILSDLRMWIAKENALEIYQGKTQSLRTGGTTGSGGGSSFDGAQSWTQTGLVTFDRDPSAPFAVTVNSAAVDNLNAALNAGLADNETITGSWDFDAGELLLPRATAPAPTTEGSIMWDTNDDLLIIGAGFGASRTMVDTTSAQTLAGPKTLTAPVLNSPTLSGTIVFPSTSYTPTFAGFTTGDGAIVGEYYQIGKFVWWRATLQMGSTSSMAASLTVTLPVTAANSFNAAATTNGLIFDASGSYYNANGVPISTSVVQLATGVSPIGGIGTSVPMTWANGDLLTVAGIYTAA